MKKLQAAMRDIAAKRLKESNVMYKVGSYFKACHNCGEYELETMGNGREVKRYTSGYSVFRSYYPSRTGWTYWCYECGAKDRAAWEGDWLQGRDAVRGSKNEYVNQWKVLPGEERAVHMSLAQKNKPKVERAARPAPVKKADELDAIRQRIQQLEQMLRGRM